MIKQFKQSLETSPLKALTLLTTKSFLYNLAPEDLQQLALLVENNQKINSKIMVAIYSILIMKKCPYVNQKKAIENLLRQYRNKKQAQKKERMVIAGLLLRIDNFTHYSTIVQDISPKVVGIDTMLKQKEKMKKQCPNKYYEMVDKYKNQWIQLINDNEAIKIRKLDADVKEFREKNEKVLEMKDCLELYEKQQQIHRYSDYLKKRVDSIQKEDLHMKNICEQINLLFSLKSPSSILPGIQSKIQQILAFSQNFLYLLIAQLCTKLKSLMFRHFQWLQNIFQKGIVNIQPTIKLKNVIYLMRSMIIAFGEGGFDKESYVFNQPYSIFKLMESILYNSYVQSEESINYQKKQKGKKNKKVTQISIYQANFVESHFEEYLHSISQIERQQILQQCIMFIYELYKRESKLGRANQFLNLLLNSKQELSFRNRCLVEKFKQLLFKEKGKNVSDVELLAEEAFENMMRKKVKKDLQFGNTYSICVLPEVKWKKNKSMNDQLIKKTKSIDMVEGWNQFAHRGSQISSSNCAPSDLFYTIKEYSSGNDLMGSSAWKDGTSALKKELSVADENEQQEMIFTPQF